MNLEGETRADSWSELFVEIRGTQEWSLLE
jgi:hypothetical protein